MNDSEVWKDVAGYEGYYKVSNKGNVFSVGRRGADGRKYGGTTLKPAHNGRGYFYVALYKNGTSERKSVHRIVAEAFIPNPNGFSEVNHKDEIKTNNYVENLEWCTRKYNVNYGTAIERATQTQSKKVMAVNVETGEVLTFNSINEAGRKGYNSGNVSLACRGIYKSGSTGKLIGDGRTYKGHRWCYEEGE